MQIWSTNSQWFQIFKFQGKQFVNVGKDEKVLDAQKDVEGQAVIVNESNDVKSQEWNVVYLDKAAKDPTKGLNKEFGFHINRPFYMVSRLPFHRVIETINSTSMQQRRYVKGRVGQQFFFDQKSKTIMSQQYKNRSWDLPQNSKTAFRIYTTNSRKW